MERLVTGMHFYSLCQAHFVFSSNHVLFSHVMQHLPWFSVFSSFSDIGCVRIYMSRSTYSYDNNIQLQGAENMTVENLLHNMTLLLSGGCGNSTFLFSLIELTVITYHPSLENFGEPFLRKVHDIKSR